MKTHVRGLCFTTVALVLVAVASQAAGRGGGGGGRGGVTSSDPNYTGPVAYSPIAQPKDRQDMLNLLGIKQTRRGLSADPGTGPMNANYSEDHVDEWPAGYAEVIGKQRPAHASTKLPELLVCKDGTKVTDEKTWWEKRRPEIVEDFEREVYGRIPKDVPKVTWQVASNTVQGNVRTKVLRGVVDNSAYPQVSVTIQATISTPANATGPVPVILTWGGGGGGGRGGAMLETPSDILAQYLQPREEQWFNIAAPGGLGGGAGGRGGGRGAGGGGSPQQMALQRGWGYGSIANGSVQPNNWTGGGIIALTAKGKPHQPDEWGTLRAWGWGLSRLCDYFETDKDVDAKSVAIEGHSFLGKTTLVATVFEPRVFTAFVSSSGEGGAKIFRRNYGEPAEGIGGTQEYYWMAGNWLKYTGPLTVDDLPVDAHEFLAMQALRPIFISGGVTEQTGGDGWQDPRGMFLACVAAGPAYKLLGKKPLTGEDGKEVTEFPPITTPVIKGDLAYREHNSGHVDTPNWPTFFTFLEHYWKVNAPAAAPAATTPAGQ